MVDEILRFDHSNINWQIAEEFARVHEDAFKDDLVINGIIPKRYRANDSSLPSLADYEDLLKRVKLFGRLVNYVARWAEIFIKKDPRNELYVLRSGETGKIVAASLWTLPEYAPVDKLSWYEQICAWFRGKYYAFLDWVSFLGRVNPVQKFNPMSEFRWAEVEMGCVNTPERKQELTAMSRKELEETHYPKDLSYYLLIMIVRPDMHGKGYGRQLLSETKKRIAAKAVPPPFCDGPAKFSLISAPSAPKFYEKMGYRLGASVDHMLPNGNEITHRYFIENID